MYRIDMYHLIHMEGSYIDNTIIIQTVGFQLITYLMSKIYKYSSRITITWTNRGSLIQKHNRSSIQKKII